MPATLPTLPTANVDLSMPTVDGTTYNVASGGDLQAALNNAAADDTTKTHEVVVEAGATFTGAFTFPAHSANTGWIIVRTSNVAGLPAVGYRAKSAHSGAMPTIRCQASAAPDPVMQPANNAQRYRFLGINFDVGNQPTGEVVYFIGNLQTPATGVDKIIWDRCLIQNSNTEDVRQALVLQGTNQAVINSSFYNIRIVSGEPHCILVGQCPGPTLTQNNYLEGYFGILIGGFSWTGIQEDITIRRNHYFRQASWGAAGNQKHFVEGKTGGRVLIEQNICDTQNTLNISDIRIYFTEFDGSGSDIYDWTIRYNKFINNAYDNPAIDFAGDFNGNRPTTARRMHAHDNLAYSYRRAFQIQHELMDLTIEHNTIDCVARNLISNNELNSPSRFVHRNNIYANPNTYDYYHDDTAQFGSQGMADFWTGGETTATNNAFVDRFSMSGMPTGDFNPSTAQVKFVNAAGGNYALDAGSTCLAGGAHDADDGTDNGCRIATLNTKLTGVEAGDAEEPGPPAPPTKRHQRIGVLTASRR